jgi:hypothetical protein
MRHLLQRLEAADLSEAKKMRSNPKHAMDPDERMEKLAKHIAEHPSVPGHGGWDFQTDALNDLARIDPRDMSKHDRLDRIESNFRSNVREYEREHGKPDKVDRLRSKLWAKTVGLADLDQRREKLAVQDNESGKHREMDPKTKAAFSRAFSALGSNERSSAGASSADDDRKARKELADVSAKHRELGAGGGHVGGEKIFTGKGSGFDKLKVGGPERKSVDVGGEDTMPGPDGEVEGKWVTLRGKRLFFPDNPGDGVPEGPWGGAPWRPGWKGRDGDWKPGRGVPKQKGQLGLFGKHESMESLFQSIEEGVDEEAGAAKAIADEILRQLGGRRFLVMTGARNLMSFDKLDDERKWPGLQVQFPQGKAKYMRIALAPSDTYTIQFMTRTGKVAKEMDDIYVDVLQRVVSDYTGLALSL